MAKKVYVGAPKSEVVTSNNVGSWFTLSDPDGISSWEGNTLTVTGVSGNERVKFTALQDMTVSFDYTTDSFCKISFNGQYICENGDSGSYTATLAEGKSFYFSNSSAISEQTCTFSSITCTSTKSVARQVKQIYVGVNSKIPLYSEGNVTKTLTASDIEDVFTVTNGSYYFAGNGTEFKSNNNGKDSSTATTTLTAKVNISAISFSYSVSSESKYDKLTITVGNTTVANAISGTVSSTWSGSLNAGQTIVMTYAKDSSQSKDNDCGTISNISVTYKGKVQIGTEHKDVARKVKKAYIGIGGVARPFWGAYEKIMYYGSIDPMPLAVDDYGASSTSSYAIFAGGYYYSGGSKYSAKTTAYNKSLTRSLAPDLSIAREQIGSGKINNHALFGGGRVGSTYYANVDVYNNALTLSSASQLSKTDTHTACASSNTYVVFSPDVGVADAYNASLTKTSFSYTAGNSAVTGAAIGGYTLFACSNTNSKEVVAIDTSLTQVSVDGLRGYQQTPEGVSTTHYAMFIGGVVANSGAGGDYVDAYDKNLTKHIGQNTDGRREFATTGLGQFAILAGGRISDYTTSTLVYDENLTQVAVGDMSQKRGSCNAACVGDYALIGGGNYGGHSDYTSAVDVYVAS